ncbi:MAG TPA: hypothetical protein PKV98_07755 [Burkholderiaceae bacterium]|nr:hypothetical protein [Burkholderiaceae bacterium]
MSLVWSHVITSDALGAGNLVGRTPTTGSAWALLSGSSPYISASGSSALFDSSYSQCAPATDPANTTQSVEVSCKPTSADSSIIGAYLRASSDGQTYYELRIRRSFGTNSLQITAITPGPSYRTIDDYSYSLTIGTTYTCVFEVADVSGDPVLTVKVDGSTIRSITDSHASKLTTGTKVWVTGRDVELNSASLNDGSGGGSSSVPLTGGLVQGILTKGRLIA